MFQLRPLRLYYSVYDGPEVPVPDDDFTERFYRSRDRKWPTAMHQSPVSQCSVMRDVKPSFGVDIKPPTSLEQPTENYFRSRSQPEVRRHRRRRRSSDDGTATEKRIKREENTTETHPNNAPRHVTMTSPRLAPPTASRGPQGASALSLPVTISKDFIKELVVSRALTKDAPERCRNAPDDHGVVQTSTSPP